jgi:hypothetical protein
MDDLTGNKEIPKVAVDKTPKNIVKESVKVEEFPFKKEVKKTNEDESSADNDKLSKYMDDLLTGGR